MALELLLGEFFQLIKGLFLSALIIIMGVIVTKYSSPHIYHSLFNRALPPLSLLLPIVVTTRPDHHHHPSAHHIVRNHCEYSYSCTFEYLEQYLPDDLSSTQMESIIIVIRQGGKNNHPEANLVHGLI